MQPITEVEKPRGFCLQTESPSVLLTFRKVKKLDFVMGILIRRIKKIPR